MSFQPSGGFGFGSGGSSGFGSTPPSSSSPSPFGTGHQKSHNASSKSSFHAGKGGAQGFGSGGGGGFGGFHGGQGAQGGGFGGFGSGSKPSTSTSRGKGRGRGRGSYGFGGSRGANGAQHKAAPASSGFGFGSATQSISPSSSPPASSFGFGSPSPSTPGTTGGGFQKNNNSNVGRAFGSSNQWKRQPSGGSVATRSADPSNSFGFSASGGSQKQAGGFGGGGGPGASKAFGPSSSGKQTAKAFGAGSSSANAFGKGKGKGKAKLSGLSASAPSFAPAAAAAVEDSKGSQKRSFTWERKPAAGGAAQGSAEDNGAALMQKKRELAKKISELERMKREAIKRMPKFAGGSGSSSAPKAKPAQVVRKKRPDGAPKAGETEMERLKREAISRMPTFAGGSKLAPSKAFRAAPKPALATPKPKPSRPAPAAPSPAPAAPAADGAHAPIVGTCEAMCPDAELDRRFRTNDFDELEQPNDDYPGLGVEELSVKRFARTITEEDRQPDRLRTRGALGRTMSHLLSLMDSKRTTFEKVHRFLWDRYRAIRTDMSIQHIKDSFAVGCLEQMIRFHIIAEHELCEETASVSNPHGFNSHLNVEQMYKCLTSLFVLYEDLAKQGEPCDNEPEFRAYYLLLTMDTHGKYRRDKSAHTFALSKMRPEILHSGFVQFAVQLNSAYHEGNFVKFFEVVSRSPYLVACILHAYFVPARRRAIRLLDLGAYGRGRTVPLSFVQRVLLADSAEEAAQIVNECGLEVRQDPVEGMVVKVGGRKYVEPEESHRKMSAFISSLRSRMRFSEHCTTATDVPVDLLPRGLLVSSGARPPRQMRRVAPKVVPALPAAFPPGPAAKPAAQEPAESPRNLPAFGGADTGTAQPSPAFPTFGAANGGGFDKIGSPAPAAQPFVFSSSQAPPQPSLGGEAQPFSFGQPGQDNSKRRRQQSVSPTTAPVEKKMAKIAVPPAGPGAAPAMVGLPLAPPSPTAEAREAARCLEEDARRARELAAEAERAAEEAERARQEAVRAEEERERERARREEEERQRQERIRREREERQRRVRVLEGELKRRFVDLVHRRLVAARLGRLWRARARLLAERRVEALKKCSLSTAILSKGMLGMSITGDARAWRPKLREEEKEAVEAIWPEAVPGAMAAPSAAASEPGREVLPAEELLEELTSALRAARDLSPHLCGSSLASMLGKILDDWLGWAARCPELDEGDRVEVCVALKELSQGVPTAGDFAGIYQYFSGRLRDLEVLHRPVWGDRKPLGKFELLGNLSLGL